MMKRMLMLVVAAALLLSMTACGVVQKKCKNGCGDAPDPQCMAGMCDSCCKYWTGLNGCYRDHR